jgi:hypothetical protein
MKLMRNSFIVKSFVFQLTRSLLNWNQLDWLVGVHRVRFGEIWKTNYCQEPMRLFVDRNYYKVLLEKIHILCPVGNARVSLLSRRQFLIFFLCHRRESLVKELTENVGFQTLVLGKHLIVDVLQVEVYDNVIEIVVRAKAYIIVRVDRDSSSSGWVNEELSYFRILQANKTN